MTASTSSPTAGARVVAILVSPIKGLRVVPRDEVELGIGGVREDRRFFLIDAKGRMVNGKRAATLQAAIAEYSDSERTLSLRLPGQEAVRGAVETGASLEARFFSETVEVAEVLGPWSQALSEHAGTELRLVEAASGAVDRGTRGGFSLIGSASVQRVAAQAGTVAPVDARRFRMLFEVDGLEAHAEDRWVDWRLRIGAATVVPRGHIGRCLVTTLNPDSGLRDLETLDALESYRRDEATTEPLSCGIYGEVIEPGVVRVGDNVVPL
jgi:uncharacterized protein